MTFVLGSLQLRAALEMQGLQGRKLAAWQPGPQRAEALLPVLEPRPLLPRSQPGAGRRGQDGRACAAAVGRSPLRSCCAPCLAAGSSVPGVEGRRGGGGRSREGADGTGGGLGRRASGTLDRRGHGLAEGGRGQAAAGLHRLRLCWWRPRGGSWLWEAPLAGSWFEATAVSQGSAVVVA